MTDRHDELADWAAAYTLGALDGADRRIFEHHLGACTRCAAEVAALAPIPGLLARIDPSDVDDRDALHTSVDALRRSRDECTRARRSAHRWRLAAIAGTAAAAILVAVLLTADATDPADPGPTRTATVVNAAAGDAQVSADERGWGTEVRLVATDLEPRDRYALWVVDAEGTWLAAGTWSPTAGGAMTVAGPSAVDTDDIARVVVTSTDRDDVLVDAHF